MQKKYQSPILWAAMVALIGFVLGNFGLYQYIGLTDTTFKTLADLVFVVLIGLGIYNNPTDSTKI
jgi:uncharacterized membrane protein (DUF373 family)